MTVTFDSVGAGANGNSASGISWSHTIASTATCLVVAVGGFFPGGSKSQLTTHTVTVGSTPLQLLGIVEGANTATWGWVELWGLLSPPTGTRTITVVEKLSGVLDCYLNANSASYIGATQFGTPVINYGTATTITSGAIVSGTANRVLSIQGGYAATLTSPTGTSRSNKPIPAVNVYTTILMQDSPGAATVTQNSTFSGPNGWGAVSANLIGGTQHHVNANTTAMTVTRSAGVNAVGTTWHVGATLALTMTRAAVGIGLPLGPSLRYVGRYPDSSGVICPVSYVQAVNAASAVTPTWVDNQVTIAAANLVTEEWVDQQVANYSTQSDVTTALEDYVPTSALGTDDGVAKLNSNSKVPTDQLPADLITNSLATSFNFLTQGTLYLPSNSTHTVTTSILGEYVVAEGTVPDPGYPWVPWPFVYILGQATGASSSTRLAGNGNFGFIAVTPVGSVAPVYAAGVCTSDPFLNYYLAMPFGAATNVQAGSGMTPLTQPPINGPLDLQVSVCCYSGNSYTFNGTGLVAYLLCLPAAGGRT